MFFNLTCIKFHLARLKWTLNKFFFRILVPLDMLCCAELLEERTWLVTSGLVLNKMGLGPKTMGCWSISTAIRKVMTLLPGQESCLNAGLLLRIEAGAGTV